MSKKVTLKVSELLYRSLDAMAKASGKPLHDEIEERLVASVAHDMYRVGLRASHLEAD